MMVFGLGGGFVFDFCFFCVWKRNVTNSTLSSSNSDTPVHSSLAAVCVPGTVGEGYIMHLQNFPEIKYILDLDFFLRRN